MVAHEDRLYVIGGRGEDSMETYSPEREEWTVSDGKLSRKRCLIGAAVMNLQCSD